ncbi:MAG: hypothetical protein H6581_04475 [Bacteroidia bacterium]|nr:hypothetical protein [Bacteroidia bacterium]
MKLEKIICWLESRRLLNLFLILVFFGLILALHDLLVNFSMAIMVRMGLPAYNLLVLGVILVVAIPLGVIFLKNLRKSGDAWGLQLVMAGGTLLFLVIHSQVLSVMNVESIHFLQFLLLSWLIFPLFRRILPTLLLTLLFALGDELFQYQILYPERESYLDLNDLLLDLYGMGAGMVILMNAGVMSGLRRAWKHFPGILWGLLFVGLLVGWLMGWIGFYANSNAPFLLNEGLPQAPFWQEFLHRGIFYHVLSPLEGFMLIILLLAFYSLPDTEDLM